MTPPPTPPNEVELHLAYAQASLMLLESLISLLVAQRVLTLDDVTEAVETAIETKKTFVNEGTHPHLAAVAAGVLARLEISMRAAELGAPDHR